MNSKVKNTVPWTYVVNFLVISTMKKMIDWFMKNNYRNQITQNLELKKSKEKTIEYLSNLKVIITHLIAGFLKNMLYNCCIKMIEYFFKPFRQFDDTGVHTSNLTKIRSS